MQGNRSNSAAWILLLVALPLLCASRAYADERWPPENPKLYKSLVDAARLYFDLDEELWVGRKALVKALQEHKRAGTFDLSDMEGVRWLVHQARSFEPDMRDRKWQRANGIVEAKRLDGTLYHIRSELLTITYSQPKRYPKLNALKTKYPRVAPYPLLLTLHEAQDAAEGERYPGQALLQRRFPKESWRDLYERWVVLAPESARARFVGPQGLVDHKHFREPLAEFWKHVHVDFDRFVLDGSEQAFAVASAWPLFFAGVVLRGNWQLDTDEQKAGVRNFAPVPVYVVDNPTLAEQLSAAGHGDVSAGSSGPGLLKWMDTRRRTRPLVFEWTARLQDQVLPYWVNLDSVDWEAESRGIRVEVLDTEEHPNTVCIRAEGIHQLALFLNDDIVDLDRRVRVLLNGHVEHDAVIAPKKVELQAIGRDLDIMFNREPVRIRQSMYFGWLKSARIVNLTVREPQGEVTCPTLRPPPPPPVEEPVEEIEIPEDEPLPPPETPAPPASDGEGAAADVSVLWIGLAVLLLLLLIAVYRVARRG